MIKGFEEFTHELTDYELTLVPKFINSFQNKIGVENAIKTSTIVEKMKAAGFKMSPPRVRKIVNYIRRTAKVKRLAATSKGYYIELDDSRWNEIVESMYQRADAIREVADKLKQQ